MYRRVISHETEEWSKLWKETDSLYEKWHGKFGVFECEQWKIWKFTLWWASFVEMYVMFVLKKYRGVALWKMTYGFRNLWNFHASSWKWY